MNSCISLPVTAALALFVGGQAFFALAVTRLHVCVHAIRRDELQAGLTLLLLRDLLGLHASLSDTALYRNLTGQLTLKPLPVEPVELVLCDYSLWQFDLFLALSRPRRLWHCLRLPVVYSLSLCSYYHPHHLPMSAIFFSSFLSFRGEAICDCIYLRLLQLIIFTIYCFHLLFVEKATKYFSTSFTTNCSASSNDAKILIVVVASP